MNMLLRLLVPARRRFFIVGPVANLFAVMALLGGCANLGSRQTARVLDHHHAMAGVGIGLTRIPFVYTTPDSVKKYGASPLVPYFDLGGRYGVWPRIDAGIWITPLYSIGIDAKYQLYAGKSLALAVGLGLGGMEIPKYDSAGSQKGGADVDYDQEVEARITDVILPFYASYDFGERFTAYVSPKFVYRTFEGQGSARQNLAGASAGFKWGSDRGGFLEVTSMHILGTNRTTTQWSVSMFRSFAFENSDNADAAE